MYCGNNKTALASQKQIAGAFLNLIKDHKYETISITMICKEADVSRQTFYSIFASKENIITYLLEENHLFSSEGACENGAMSLREMSREYSAYITESREILTMMAENKVFYMLHDCLYDSFIACNCKTAEISKEQKMFMAEFFAGGLSGIARTYVQLGGEMSAEALDEMIYQLFSGSMLR